VRYNDGGKILLRWSSAREAFYILCFWMICSSLLAQPTNGWINFNQEYCKISTAKDGIYRVTYADLQAVGFTVSVDPRNIQLFHRGIEQPITVTGSPMVSLILRILSNSLGEETMASSIRNFTTILLRSHTLTTASITTPPVIF